MNTAYFKQLLFRNWTFMRVLRLILGISLGYQAYQMSDAFAWIFSGFFLFQAFSNTGCAGGSCSIPERPKREATSIEK